MPTVTRELMAIDVISGFFQANNHAVSTLQPGQCRVSVIFEQLTEVMDYKLH
jgi:hypothetical protein